MGEGYEEVEKEGVQVIWQWEGGYRVTGIRRQWGNTKQKLFERKFHNET